MMTRLLKWACAALTVALLAVTAIDYARADEWDDFPSNVRSAKRRYDTTVGRAVGIRDKAIDRANTTYEREATVAAKSLVDAIKTEATREPDAEIKTILREVSVTVEGTLLPTTKTPREMIPGKWVNSTCSGRSKATGKSRRASATTALSSMRADGKSPTAESTSCGNG